CVILVSIAEPDFPRIQFPTVGTKQPEMLFSKLTRGRTLSVTGKWIQLDASHSSLLVFAPAVSSQKLAAEWAASHDAPRLSAAARCVMSASNRGTRPACRTRSAK